jgi:Rod binding domain-containing protein
VTPVAATASAALALLNVTMPRAQSTNSGNTDSPELSKLRKAAGEFESILLASLWKSMKETFSDPDEEADPTLKSFDDWGIQAMASAVGNSGGLGIKNMILKYLEPTLSEGGRGATPAQ